MERTVMTTPYIINIVFNFANGDPSAIPTVTTSTSISDSISADYGSIEWNVEANIQNTDGLFIDTITFYSDQPKRIPVAPGFFDAGVWNAARKTYTVPFNATAVAALTTLYYGVWYRDNDMTSDTEWDPTLKIQPRIASGSHGA